MTVEEIFLIAVEKAPEERSACLDSACAGNDELRVQVEALVRAHEHAGSLLEQPLFRTASTIDHPTPSAVLGGAIGPYKLVELIAEGGMGSVYLAQQTEPVRRLVALKVIKAGMDSRAVLARFEAERQALALMDHPNIAKVLDAGTTGRPDSQSGQDGGIEKPSYDPGRPYFVMELVKGVPITKFCDERRLTPRERLELFLPVCHAIQHAHQKGIIHRDIKPTNVLVALYDGKPVPKVIDFGVAKAAGQPLTEKTLVTGLGAVVGTPEYMSPEQAELNQLDIDTRSDIYSLGVLLYELLTGTTPLTHKRFKEAALLEVLRVIREEEPQKPSTRLSTTDELPLIADKRGTEPLRLSRLVRGELDWLVMKALEKDRSRRYETASSFAADLQRYLSGDAVLACPPSAGYRVRKFVRRYRVVLTFAGLVAASLLLGTAISIWQAARARGAEKLAQQRLDETEEARQGAVGEGEKAKAVINLIQEMLSTAHPDAAKGPNYTVRQLLDDFEAGLADRLNGQPEVEGDLRTTIGLAYKRMGLLHNAEKQLRRGMELRRQALGAGHQKVAASLTSLAWSAFERKDWAEAAELGRQAIGILRPLDNRDEDLGLALRVYAMALENQGKDLEEIERIWREALHLAERCSKGKPTSLVANVTGGLGFCLIRQGEVRQAEPIAVRAVELHRKVHGNVHSETGWGLVWLSACYSAQYQFAEAERASREALSIFRRIQGDSDHSSVWEALAQLVFVLGAQFKDEEIEAILVECNATSRKHENAFSGADRVLFERGRACLYRGDLEEAVAWLSQARDVGRKARGPFSPAVWSAQLHLGGVLFMQDKPAEAREAVSGIVRLLQLVAQRPDAAAGKRLMYAIALMIDGCEKPELLSALESLTRGIVEQPGGDPDQKAFALIVQSKLDLRAGSRDRGIGRLRDALALTRPLALLERRLAAKTLVEALKEKGDWASAEQTLCEELAKNRQALPEGHPEVVAAHLRLADLLTIRQRYADAEALLIRAFAMLNDHPRATSMSLKRRRSEAVDHLVRLYDEWGQPEKATRWKQHLTNR